MARASNSAVVVLPVPLGTMQQHMTVKSRFTDGIDQILAAFVAKDHFAQIAGCIFLNCFHISFPFIGLKLLQERWGVTPSPCQLCQAATAIWDWLAAAPPAGTNNSECSLAI